MLASRHLLLAVGLLLGLTVSATAQTIPDQTVLGERLGVSEATAGSVHQALTAAEQRPGFLWDVSSTLATELSAEQKDELLAAAPDRAPRQRGAERGDRQERRATLHRSAHSHRDVDLSTEQREQMQEITQRFLPLLQEVQDASRDMDAETARERFSELRSEMREAMDAVLTPEQREQALAQRERMQRHRADEDRPRQERRVRMREHRPEMEEARRARQEALSLTDEQREELRAPALERRQRSERAIRSEAMSPEQREIVQIHAALQRALRVGSR